LLFNRGDLYNMIDYDKPILNKNGEPLKIIEAAAHHCIRCIKKATALKKIGYEIHGIGDKAVYGQELYDTYSVWKNERQFKNIIALHIAQRADIISWDNEPDHPVTWIRDVIKEMNSQYHVKLVADLHDLDSVRRKENVIPKTERFMFNHADAFIYCSLPIQKMTNDLHVVNKPNIVLYSYCNDGIVEYDDSQIKNRKNMIYEGGINCPDDRTMNTVFPYRDLFPILQQLINQGNEVHAFPGNGDAYVKGQHTGVVLYPPTEYDKMMQKLIEFKWGILIFNNKNNTEPQVKYTLTNKAHEYLQAGLPSITCWCEESEKWIKKHGIGLVFSSIEEIGDCSSLEDKYIELMSNIYTKRKELVMENFIWRVENMYAGLLGVDTKGIPDKISNLSKLEYDE